MEKAKQIDDHVQNSMMGAVKPLAEHPGSGDLVPVSAATPDAEPKAERKLPPQKTGHGIGSETPANAPVDGPYRDLPKELPNVADDKEAMHKNAEGAREKDSNAVSTTSAPVDSNPVPSDTPFPRATSAQPVQGVTGPKNAEKS